MQPYPDNVQLEDRPCPNGCASADDPVLIGHDRLHDIPGEFSVLRCRNCQLMRTNPRPTRNTIGAYYPPDYGPYQDEGVQTAKPASPIRQRIDAWLGLTSRQLPPLPPGRLLEIGCASGQFLEASQLKGWHVEGIEFSAEMARRARQKGLNVQATTIESATPPAETVDVVAAWMVLEHLHEPVQALQRLRTWVKDDGYLIASIPDASSWEQRFFTDHWYALQLPTHLYHYTPHTVAKLLARGGWQLERIAWQRNCQSLLRSIESICKQKGLFTTLRLTVWFRTAKGCAKLRLLLGWLLGVCRQSGRMEIWARPLPLHKSKP